MGSKFKKPKASKDSAKLIVAEAVATLYKYKHEIVPEGGPWQACARARGSQKGSRGND